MPADTKAKKMRVLVTGGAGFIGSNLIHCLKEKHEVFVLDNFSAGASENIQSVPGLACDIREINNVPIRFSPDLVIHLAAINSLPYSVKHPKITYEINVHGTAETAKPQESYQENRLIYAA